MATPPRTRAELAAEAWQPLFDFVVATVGHRTRALARLGLTPNDSRALAILDARSGKTMRALADELGCDASTATWVVDRLEAKGLAARKAHPTDRRVKLVVLTSDGVRTRSEMARTTSSPPPELAELDEADLRALGTAAAKLRLLIGTPAAIEAKRRSSDVAG